MPKKNKKETSERVASIAGKVLQDRRSAPAGYAPERTVREPGHALVNALG